MTTPPGVRVDRTWVWFGRDRWSTGRPDRSAAVESGARLGPAGAVAAVVVGVLLAVLAVRVATAVLPGSFRAQARVAVVADDRVVPDADDAGPERGAQVVLDRGIPVAEPLIGPVRLVTQESPAGSAVATGVPAELVLAATAPAGFLLGVLLVLAARSTALHVRGRRTSASLQ